MGFDVKQENLAKANLLWLRQEIHGQSIVFATMLLRSLVVCGLSVSRRLFLSLAFTQAADGIILMPNTSSKTIRILIHGGDNMLGRAVQLSFPVQAPGEQWIRDSCTADHYMTMALHSLQPTLSEIRQQNENCGSYLWDQSRFAMKHEPDVCLLNLETAVTKTISNSDIPSHKGIHYHMHVDNFETIMAGFPFQAPVVVCFANNHSLDFGRKAFEEESLPFFDQTASVTMIGCGRNFREAATPAVVHCHGVEFEIFAVATGCSGAPRDWWATEYQSGLVGLPSLTNSVKVVEAMNIIRNVISNSPSSNSRRVRILSIHWGPNWALKHESKAEIAARRDFAHRVIDECGVDLIYGHSSHHIRGIERYKQKLILYGAGDIINDYEGFENPGEERYVKLGGIFVVDLTESGELRQPSHQSTGWLVRSAVRSCGRVGLHLGKGSFRLDSHDVFQFSLQYVEFSPTPTVPWYSIARWWCHDSWIQYRTTWRGWDRLVISLDDPARAFHHGLSIFHVGTTRIYYRTIDK